MTALMVSQALSWLVIAALSVVVLALARQIGVLHERIAPVGALVTEDGPAVGATLPRFDMQTLDGVAMAVAGPGAGLRLLLFVASDCPICKRIVGLARDVTRVDGVGLTLIGDEPAAALLAMRKRLSIADVPFVRGSEIGLALRIGKLPYAVLIDHQSVIRAKGLVNSREHLESLLVANETGHASVQDYLRSRELTHAAE